MTRGDVVVVGAGVGGIAAALSLARRGFRVTLAERFAARHPIGSPVYQSDGRILPWLRDRLFAPASRAPGAERLLAGLVAGEIGRGGVSRR